MHLGLLSVYINRTFCQFDFSAIWRGFALYHSYTESRFSAVVLTVTNSSQQCYLIQSTSWKVSYLYQSLLFPTPRNGDSNRVWNCSMSNDTCGYVPTSSITVCGRGTGSIIVPEELVLQYKLLDLCAKADYYNTTGDQAQLRSTFDLIASTMSYSLEEDDPLRKMFASALDCTTATFLPNVPETNMRSLAIAFALRSLQTAFKRSVCTSSIDVPPVPTTDTFSDICERDSLDIALSYLKSPIGYVIPPVSLDSCRRPFDSPSGSRRILFPWTNITLDVSEGEVISISSLSILSNFTSGFPNISRTCADQTSPVPPECEEIPSYLCDSYVGCWVAWGPCQPVSVGYYSPSGTTSQIPCASIDSERVFISGDSVSVCNSACLDSSKILVNGSCITPPVGFTAQPACNGSMTLVPCEKSVDAFIFTHRGSCEGRFVSTALGDTKATSPESFTVQSWVQMNSIMLATGGPGNYFPIYGRFGTLSIGIEFLSDIEIRITMFVMSERFVGTLDSDPIPHVSLLEWVHIAVVVAGSEVTFFVNGGSAGVRQIVSSLVARSVPTLVSSFLSDVVSSQLQAYLNREHFGPFRLTNGDLKNVHGSNPWSVYLVNSYIEFNLFKPQIINQALDVYGLDFFGRSPPGVREPASLGYDHFVTNVSCDNICLKNSIKCGTACAYGFWNPFSCECILASIICSSTTSTTTTTSAPATTTSVWFSPSDVPVVSTFTHAPSSTVTKPASFDYSRMCTTTTVTVTFSSDVTAEVSPGNTSDIAIGGVIAVCVVGGLLCFLIKRRRVNLVIQGTHENSEWLTTDYCESNVYG